VSERRLAVLAAVVLSLQLAAAALPVAVADGPPVALPAGPPVRCGTEGAACRGERVWPAGTFPNGVRAVASTRRTPAGGIARLVLASPAGRWAAPVPAGSARVVVDAPGFPRPDRVLVVVQGDGEEVVVEHLAVGPARRSAVRTAVLASWWVAAGALAAGAAHRLAAAMDAALLRVLAALAPLVVVGLVMPSAALDAVLLSVPGARPEDLGKDLFTEPTVAVVAQKVGGHGLAFAALAFVATRAEAGAGRALAWLAWLAVASESVQALLPDRSAKGGDVVVDLLGAVVGVAAGRAWRRG
jgi:hypothetical protein